ncbi:MAG: LptF/LptG family permease [Gemmatimonadetes bacterium]|nr:LptF/LptG family permease [Gemmatimonadota bacterium]
MAPFILDRYVLREFFKILLLSILCSTVIFVLIHVMDHIDGYLDHDATLGEVAAYYLYQLPYNAVITLPMAMLIATILTMGDLGRHEEITAMKAGGRSLFRIVLPILLTGLTTSLGVLVLGETAIPRMSARAEEIHDVQIAERRNEYRNYRADFPYQSEAGWTFLIRSLFADTTSGASADQVEVQKTLADGTFIRINSPRMYWEPGPGRWVLTDGYLRQFPRGGSERSWRFGFLSSPQFTETPQDFLQVPKEPEEMSYAELARYINRKGRTGGDTVRERVDLHMKVAYPFANFVIVLFGVTLAGRSARQRGAALGFGLALFLCIFFWAFIKVGQGIGYGGGIEPWLAAWLANMIFGGLGVALLLRARS